VHQVSLFSFCRFLPAFVLVAITTFAHATTCHVTQSHVTTAAEQAFLTGDFERAAGLYQEQLQHNPKDSEATVGLVHALLKQQKVTDADDLVQKELAQDPNSVPLLVAKGEVQYREGKPWLAAQTADTAMNLDPCNAQLRLLEARLFRLNSFYAMAQKEITTAHALSPNDPSIRLNWLETLPRTQRISELERYLGDPTGDDSEQIKHLHVYLDYLKKRTDQPHQPCRLVSDTSSTSIPFTAMMEDGTHLRAWGLEVKLNNRGAHLDIDTGASGIVISRSVANRAGLQRFSDEEIGGVGDKGEKAGYTAFAKSIRIGSLEFRDCEVDVVDKRNVVDSDGLIGMDVFSRFLITLDYPMHKLLLDPLPPRPGDTVQEKPTLETAVNLDDDDEDGSASSGNNPKAAPVIPHDRYIAPEMKNWTPVYRVGHNLLIPASLNKSNNKLFILDTGAFTTTVTPAVARQVTKVHSNYDMTVEGMSGKVNKVYSANEITFQFANLSQKVRDVVSFDSPQVSKGIGMEVSGFIGFTALGQTTMKIDYRDGLVSFSYDATRGYHF